MPDKKITKAPKWTKAHPKVEGFYRVRTATPSKLEWIHGVTSPAIPEDIYHVFFEPDGTCAFHLIDDVNWMYAHEFPHAEWMGPVNAPPSSDFAVLRDVKDHAYRQGIESGRADASRKCLENHNPYPSDSEEAHGWQTGYEDGWIEEAIGEAF